MKSCRSIRLPMGIPDNKFLCEFISDVIDAIFMDQMESFVPAYILKNYAHYGIITVKVERDVDSEKVAHMELEFDSDENKTMFILKYL